MTLMTFSLFSGQNLASRAKTTKPVAAPAVFIKEKHHGNYWFRQALLREH